MTDIEGVKSTNVIEVTTENTASLNADCVKNSNSVDVNGVQSNKSKKLAEKHDDKNKKDKAGHAVKPKETNFFNKACGANDDFKMALYKNTTHFSYKLDEYLKVGMQIHKEHNAVDVDFTRSKVLKREMTVCHTFGSKMMRVNLKKRKKRQMYSIMINSHSSSFICFVIMPERNRGVCGQFKVQKTSTHDSVFVMFVVFCWVSGWCRLQL